MREILLTTSPLGFYPTGAQRTFIQESIDDLQLRISLFDEDIKRLQSTRANLQEAREIFLQNAVVEQAKSRRYLRALTRRSPKKPEDSKNAVYFTNLLDDNRVALRSLLKSRYRAHREISAYTSLISPVRNIPAEIWEQIFLYCLTNEDFILPRPNNAPLLLCQVSRSWRRIATSIPSLWCSLSIQMTRQLHRKTFLESWLSRSGNLPLSLEISWCPTATTYFYDYVLRYLIQFAHRWRRLRLSFRSSSYYGHEPNCSRVRGMLSARMPLLETLELDSSVPVVTLSIPPGKAPKLRVLRLLKVEQNPIHLSMPWWQITHFSSHHILGMPKMFYLLRRCPNIEVCEMRVESYPLSVPMETVLKLERLHTLLLTNSGGECLDALLASLELPALCDLYIRTELHSPQYDGEPWTVLGLQKLAARSGPGFDLKKFTVVGYKCSPKIIQDLQFSFPMVEFNFQGS
ncbi:hypothetical protein BDQ12DRAFT_42202 [Crucibulum laeve]|uniref:Uncharacterized protein n=1 Tax=Crucibulum laeve TaxID=68775 RepID=A0A5C3MHR9_9AGAR|nr:hypothetical protein BDQ12DRAFT_42202 [Crucibulum laeve]